MKIRWLLPALLAMALSAQDKQEDTVLMFCSKCIGKGKGNFLLYHKISEQKVKIKDGDKLCYDIFLTSDQPELKGGVDIQFSDGSNLRDADVKDQNGLRAHGDSVLEPAKGKWYTRTFDLSALAGRTTSAWDIQCEGDAPGTYVQFLDNILIEGKDGWQTKIYENGKPAIDDLHWREGYSKGPSLVVLARSKVAEGPELKKAIEIEVNRYQLRDLAKKHGKELDTMNEILKREGQEALIKDVEEARAKTPDPETFDGTPEAYLEALHQSCHKLAHAHPFMAKYTGHLVGHAHIDLQWLWDWNEGIEVTRQTFAQATKFMDEFPDFKFSQSSGTLYLAMEERYPELFQKVKKYIEKGNWEIVGGRWCEGDTNMISGESHARHFLQCQRYYREKFGRDAKVGWEPDTFGHTWQMPQMLRLAGIESYYFCRAGAGKPLFWWQGPDGSKVLAFDEPALKTGSWYNADLTGKEFKELTKFHDMFGANDMLLVYGVGNHGGGPTLENIKTAKEWQKSPYLPSMKFSTATEFFDQLRKTQLHDVETFNGELNAVFHGCYTTHGQMKRYNRDSEALVVQAETAAAIASRFGYHYSRKEFQDIWRDILWNHHHDTLPGSFIHKSALYSYELYKKGLASSRRILDDALSTLAESVEPCEPNSLMVFNSLGWTRDAVVVVKAPEGLPEGQLVANDRPVQRTEEGELVFVAKDLPAFGYRIYKIDKAPKKAEPVHFERDGAKLSTDRYDLEIDPASGAVTRLFDKKLGKELASKPLNDLAIHWEGPHGMAAWEIGPIQKVLRPTDAEKIELVECGPVRARVRVKRGYGASAWSQDILVYRDLDVVEFQLAVDWKEKGSAKQGCPFLRTMFPLDVPGAKPRYEIPFGDIERPEPKKGDIAAPAGAGPDSKDVAALQWADVSNGEFGVALLNDSKHGYQAKDGALRLSIVRSSWEPDPEPDLGHHFVRYALVPHAGSIHDAGLPKRGFEFNVAPATHWMVRAGGAGAKPAGWNIKRDATLKREMSFLSIGAKNVVATALKLGEDGPEWILRFYESSGQKTETALTCAYRIEKAETVNFIEDRLGDADPAHISLRGYEIQSLKLRVAQN